MNKKVSLLLLSIVLAIGIFIASTYLQKKAVNYVPTIKCLIVQKDIDEYMMIEEQDLKYVEMPLEIVANSKVVKNYSEISDLYLKDKIYKGQMLLLDQFDTQKNLMIFNGEEGKEKISIKIKTPENGVSYIVKPGSKVNVYATINSDYTIDGVFKESEKQIVGDGFSGYSIIKILSDVKVISTFNENGEEIESGSERNIDTILVAATPEEATCINLVREIATFNITEL